MSATQIALDVKGTGVEAPVPKRKRSAFTENGMAQEVEARKAEIKALYLESHTPMIVGWSGGKDSTATLQLVWSAIQELDSADLTTPVHVISTDTLVENPVIAAYVAQALDYYDEANLDVTIQEPTDLLVEAVVTSGAAQFGVGYQEFFTYALADGMPLVSVAVAFK